MREEMMDPRKTFGETVTNVAKENEDIVVLSADSGKSSGFGEFMELFPDRYYECGIMEQGVVGIASGLAAVGKTPVFCAIAPFVTARPFEMFRNDLGYMKQNVKIVGRNCGFTYSDLGATHHSLEDFAIIRMIPGVIILAPQDPGEIRAATRAMLKHKGPVYMRIGNPKIPMLFEEQEFEIGKGRRILEGTDVTIITTGSLTANVLKAAQTLKEAGISPEVIGMPTVSPVDESIILDSVKKTGRAVTVEEHYVTGGLGSIVSELCVRNNPVPVKMLGVKHEYAATGSYEELLSYYGLDACGITKSVKSFLDKQV